MPTSMEADYANEIEVLRMLDSLTVDGDNWLADTDAEEKEFLTNLDFRIGSATCGMAEMTLDEYSKVCRIYNRLVMED